MSDINEIKFSGTIERLQSINTKTGTRMAKCFLKVGQDSSPTCIFLKNVADPVLLLADGHIVEVRHLGVHS